MSASVSPCLGVSVPPCLSVRSSPSPDPLPIRKSRQGSSPTALEAARALHLPAISTTVAAATATSTTTAAASTAATSVAPATSTATASRLERLGLVDRQGTSGELHAGEFLDRRLALRLGRKLYEREPARAAGVTIRDDSYAVDNSALREQIAQFGLGDFEREIPYVKSHVPSHL